MIVIITKHNCIAIAVKIFQIFTIFTQFNTQSSIHDMSSTKPVITKALTLLFIICSWNTMTIVYLALIDTVVLHNLGFFVLIRHFPVLEIDIPAF